jgi:hypothetical protein
MLPGLPATLVTAFAPEPAGLCYGRKIIRLAAVILRGLAKLPDERFGSVADFIRAIEVASQAEMASAA